MKKAKKIIKFSLITLLIILFGLLSFIKFALPNVGAAENITIERTAQRIERGAYLANNVCVCMDCHSKRDWSKFSGPLIAGTLGQGGEEFSQKYGFPGKYYSKNITPFALSKWTDGEILRAITTGVNKDGKALFPVMPHPNYGTLDKEDILAIIAYLRILAPIENTPLTSSSDFPMNFIINTIPKKAAFSKIPDATNKIAYGAYLCSAASCTNCHTQQDKGNPVENMEFAGGFKFPLITGGTVYSANITPDVETGIGDWTEDAFVNRFKSYADSSYRPNAIAQGNYNTVMPWLMYCNMKEADLRAIYAYLRTLKPISNTVTKFVP